MVEADIKLSVADLYDYNLRHSYTKVSTLLATVVGIAGIFAGIYFQDKYWIMMVVIGALLIVYTPFTLLVRCSQTFALNPSMKNQVHYVFDENGITVSQGENSETCSWEQVVKVVSTGRSIIVYTSKVSASIFPRKQLGDSLPLLIQTIAANIEPSKNKIRT